MATVVKMQTVRNRHAIDEYGRLAAQIADLKAQQDALKEHFAGWGEGAYEGDTFRITVSKSERETLDMAAVRAKLSRQFIAANTKVTPVTTIRAVARTAENITLQDALNVSLKALKAR